MKILLIDDDMFMRDMYATKFTECGHDVTVFDQPEKALSHLKGNNKHEVILVDMVMPSMSGTQFLLELKKEGLQKDTMCIVLSNQGQQGDINEAMEAGAVSYIVKAEHVPSEVVSKVEEIFAEHNKDKS